MPKETCRHEEGRSDVARRRRTRGARSREASDAVPIAVLDGTLRHLYETSGLDVTLSLRRDQDGGGQITVTSDDGELGTWPVDSVAIRSFDSTSYEFYSDGDLLLFTPVDLIGFHTSPFIVGLPPDTDPPKRSVPRLKRFRSKPAVGSTRAKTVRGPANKKRVRDKRAADLALPETEDRPTPAPPEAVAETVVPDAGVEADSPPVAPDAGFAESVAPVEPAAEPEPDDTPTREFRTRNVVWIRALDIARRYDLFDLDRVPTDKRLRGSEHQHTWDHRVARPDGFASHVCTICGKVRLSRG